MKKAILFDLTNTLQLFDWEKMEKGLSEIIPNFSLQTYKKYYNEYQSGKIKNDKQFFEKILAERKEKFVGKQIEEIIQKHYSIRKNFVFLPENLQTTLSELKKDFSLAVLSNGIADWAQNDWEMLGFPDKKIFETEIYSQNTCILKPEKRAFEIALQKIGVKAEQAVMVGDSEEEDMQGAKQAGLSTVWLKKERGKNCEYADYVIWNLEELLQLKKEW